MSFIHEYLESLCKAVKSLPEEKIRDAVDTLKAAHISGHQVFLLGNGGSAMTAAHIACDLQKGVKQMTGKRFAVLSIADNVAILTAWANDTDYENTFSEQLDSLVRPGDIVIAISGSGNSPNVIKAVERANELGAITMGWSGFDGGKLAEVAQKSIVVDSHNMQRVEDLHTIIGHVVFATFVNDRAVG